MIFSTTPNHYFESHITIDPVMDDRQLTLLKSIVKPNGFKVARLLMQKGGISDVDSFMTARSKNYDEILGSTEQTVWLLGKKGFNVRRWKIE